MAPTSKLNANGVEIGVIGEAMGENAYLSLTDIARYKNPDEPKAVVANWMRLRSTIEFLGLWEQIHNPDFKGLEFDAFKNESGSNAFTLSPQKWISSTNAIGLVSRSGRYGGGTYAHTDIAFEFASWVSPEFKLYIIKDGDYKNKINFMNFENIGKNSMRSYNGYTFINSDFVKQKIVPLVNVFYIYPRILDCLVITNNEILITDRSFNIKKLAYKIKNTKIQTNEYFCYYLSKTYGNIKVIASKYLYIIIEFGLIDGGTPLKVNIYEPKIPTNDISAYCGKSNGCDEYYNRYIANKNEDLCCTFIP